MRGCAERRIASQRIQPREGAEAATPNRGASNPEKHSYMHNRKEVEMAKERKLKVYLESGFVSCFTGRESDDAKIAGFRNPQIIAPQIFLGNLTLEKRK